MCAMLKCLCQTLSNRIIFVSGNVVGEIHVRFPACYWQVLLLNSPHVELDQWSYSRAFSFEKVNLKKVQILAVRCVLKIIKFCNETHSSYS